MTTNAKLFLVEGPDLAGKTSACNKLAVRISPRPEHGGNALSGKNALYDAADDLRKADGLDGAYLGHAYLAAAALESAASLTWDMRADRIEQFLFL